MPAAPESFQEVFEHLRAILQKYEPKLVVIHDTPDNYYLNAPLSPDPKKNVMFGAVQIKKNYVSFHFMPIYAQPRMSAGLSEELRKRMQGKACFNFKEVDKTLFKELAALTKAGCEGFKAMKFI